MSSQALLIAAMLLSGRANPAWVGQRVVMVHGWGAVHVGAEGDRPGDEVEVGKVARLESDRGRKSIFRRLPI